MWKVPLGFPELGFIHRLGLTYSRSYRNAAQNWGRDSRIEVEAGAGSAEGRWAVVKVLLSLAFL